MTLGERVKTLREARGWSQAELARQAHVRQALISELETGKKTDTRGSILQRLARVLLVSVDYLVGNLDPPRSPEEGRSAHQRKRDHTVLPIRCSP